MVRCRAPTSGAAVRSVNLGNAEAGSIEGLGRSCMASPVGGDATAVEATSSRSFSAASESACGANGLAMSPLAR